MLPTPVKLFVLFLLCLLPWTSFAGQNSNFRQLGDYTLYYDVVPTAFLDPQIAQAYGVTRSQGQGLLRITVLHKQGDQLKPVRAMVSGQVGNLAGQTNSLSFRQVEVGQNEGYSTLATFRYTHDQPLRFNLQVSYAAGQPPEELHFIRRLYIE